MDVRAEGFPLTAGVSKRVAYVEHTGSTNADLVVASADTEAYPHGSVLITFDQRSGRGRLDRSWTAPAGTSMAVSTIMRVGEIPVHARGWIPLAAGLAMTEAIRAQLPGHDVGAKWPNDVLVDGGKICGILAEATLAFDTVVIGAGINTTMSLEQLPVQTATSFAVAGGECHEDKLIRDFIVRLDQLLGNLARAGGDPDASGLRAEVVAVSATVGNEVKVSMPDGSELIGSAADIDAEGRLVVETVEGITAVSAGDVIHARRIG